MVCAPDNLSYCLLITVHWRVAAPRSANDIRVLYSSTTAVYSSSATQLSRGGVNNDLEIDAAYSSNGLREFMLLRTQPDYQSEANFNVFYFLLCKLNPVLFSLIWSPLVSIFIES